MKTKMCSFSRVGLHETGCFDLTLFMHCILDYRWLERNVCDSWAFIVILLSKHTFKPFLQQFQTITGWTERTVAPPNLYIIEPGLLYPSNAGFNGSLMVTLNNGCEVEIPNYELRHPLRGIAENGSRVLSDNITEVNVYNTRAPLHTAVSGKVFLSRVSHPPRYVFSH